MLKPEVLRNKKDFTALYKRGKSVGGKYVVLFYRGNGLSYNRKAFLASKKVGNSVKRNRARRLMKEGFRTAGGDITEGYDILFIARNTIERVKCGDVAFSIKAVLKKSKIWREGGRG
ncbi:MAG: ribonuclease P protein component [Clostridiales Family XIII bacterium]|jgi:ribonuclease P protein component|nr:ribonuclease P protein component [Clostridiales Family XIII bacterium]